MSQLNEALIAFRKSQNNAGHFEREQSFAAEEVRELFDSPQQHAAVEAMFRVLQKTNSPSGDPSTWRVLDIGSSIGAFAFALAPRVKEVVGTDIEAEAITCANAWARDAGVSNTSFYTDSFNHISSEAKGPFDLIVVKEVAEHLGSAERLTSMLHEFADLLAPGGCVYLETPNYLFPFEPHLRIVIPPLTPSRTIKKIAALRGMRGASDDSFFTALLVQSPHRIAKLARAAGFEVFDAGAAVRLPEIIEGRKPTGALRILSPFLRVARVPVLKKVLVYLARITHAYPTVTFVLTRN